MSEENCPVDNGFPFDLNDDDLHTAIQSLTGQLRTCQHNQITWCSSKLQAGLIELQRRQQNAASEEQVGISIKRDAANRKAFWISFSLSCVSVFVAQIALFLNFESSQASAEWQEQQLTVLSRLDSKNKTVAERLTSIEKQLSNTAERRGASASQLSSIHTELKGIHSTVAEYLEQGE